MLAVWSGVLLSTVGPQLTAQSYLVIVTGSPGEERYERRFAEWAERLRAAAATRYGIPADRILELTGSGATRDGVVRALSGLASRVEAEALVAIVLLGHGSAAGGEPRFNIPGPDLTAKDFAGLLDAFPTQEIVFVNLTSASGDFVPALSGPRRIVITATKSGLERNEALFGGFFIEALEGDAADTDQDGQVSLLEAFTYARHEVARAYEREGQLLTEHALLDDDGDGRGSVDPGVEGPDGRRAGLVALQARDQAAGAEDPELARLYREQRRLEAKLAALRAAREGMDPQRYEAQLEALLIEIARVGRAIRERGGRE